MKQTPILLIVIFLMLVGIAAYMFVAFRQPAAVTETMTATTTLPSSAANANATASAPATATDAPLNMGTYPYACDEHVMFSMTPLPGMKSIHIEPTTGTYPPSSTLLEKPATSGVRYEGNGVIFTAKGETVVLGEGDSAIQCSPVEFPDSAPFNFGD